MAFHSQNFEIFSDKEKLCGLVMSKKSVFENTGAGFSSLGTLQEPESLKDQLK